MKKFAMRALSVCIAMLGAAIAQTTCGPDGSFSIAGSSTVLPIAEAWADAYMSNCPGVIITVEGGGSSDGAGRVCGNEEDGSPVEIGGMSRQWDTDEATEADSESYVYQCVAGNTSRSAIQLDVAIDGLSVVTLTGSPAASCIQTLGGLTIDQLRWMFSNYTDSMLDSTGWDPSSLANSDNDDTTKLWSELDPSCEAEQVLIAGPDDQSGTYAYFSETIFADLDNGEGFDAARPYFNSVDDEEIVSYVEFNGDAVAYIGYAYYFEEQDKLDAAPIQNESGDFVTPDSTTIVDGSYNPFSRRIFMNLLNDNQTLMMTAPFMQFGYSDAGSQLVEDTGYVLIPNTDEMLARIPSVELAPSGTPPTSPTASPPTASAPTGSGSSSSGWTPSAFIWFALSFAVIFGI